MKTDTQEKREKLISDFEALSKEELESYIEDLNKEKHIAKLIYKNKDYSTKVEEFKVGGEE